MVSVYVKEVRAAILPEPLLQMILDSKWENAHKQASKVRQQPNYEKTRAAVAFSGLDKKM